MLQLRHILIFLVLSFAACTTIPSESESFDVELISIQATYVPQAIDGMGPIDVPGYEIKFRRDALGPGKKIPDRTSYNFALASCGEREFFKKNWWIYEVDQFDDGSAIYVVLFYKENLDSSDVPRPLCARVLVGKRKSKNKGVGFETVKRPIWFSNEIRLELPI